MDIVLLGSGNVATHLGDALVQAGHRITQVYSPTEAHAQALADPLGAAAINHPTAIDVQADIYIIAVKDDVLATVAAQLPNTLRGTVVHTAGSVDMAVLAAHTANYGVLYPVQTFSKAKAVDFSTIPLAVEASGEAALARLEELAGSLSKRVFRCDSKQRLSLHTAAVFACNFTNHFYTIAADILNEHGLEFDLIRPLILETAQKVMEHAPKDAQTGPAVRNDRHTMEKHLALLEANPALAKLYRLISERIR
ncbi:Rossmann-like and DUF2520 domain-containing protein [Parapedobacter sp. 10938]|uniref:Rossmann-like and DUF2520 domain-containing protein n=1 Tax=Parapedobacter flavus TaxID=3110225 RepID=UPI002DBFCCD6|nr:F420-dependent NADP oxidoreductase [Parapedobacter sp. 10938]MEC3878269.1 F420-dependent NADP oxidoreductase [Parapedobacter sp. 10938]